MKKKLQIEAKLTQVNEHFYAKNLHYVYESRCQKIQKKVFNINAFFWHENNAQLSMKQMKFNMQYFV